MQKVLSESGSWFLWKPLAYTELVVMDRRTVLVCVRKSEVEEKTARSKCYPFSMLARKQERYDITMTNRTETKLYSEQSS